MGRVLCRLGQPIFYDESFALHQFEVRHPRPQTGISQVFKLYGLYSFLWIWVSWHLLQGCTSNNGNWFLITTINRLPMYMYILSTSE